MRQLFIQGMATMLAIFPLWGETIDPSQAARIAANHLSQQHTLRSVPQLTLAHTEQSPLRATAPDYYAFNIGDNQGYILIAGDDNVASVLGWTTEGRFQVDSLPSNLQAHLRHLQNEIAAGRKQPLGLTAEPVTKATSEQEVVLNTARWGQDLPYNRYCPMQKDMYCLTGCLATAASIIMRYHKHPAQAINGVSSYYGQPVEYTPLLWKYMPNSTPFLSDSQEQVAALMWQFGANSNLTYSTRETSGRLDSALVALRHNFDYSQEARLLLEQAYTTQQWDQLIHAEIDAERPVLYGGQALLNEVQYGHAFVIDGYQGEDYYHVNWGWNGQSNGFFRLHALEVFGLNYDRDQAMIIGIKPAEATDQPVTEICYVEWTLQSTMHDSYQTELALFNAGSHPFTGEIALAKVTPNGEIQTLVTECGTLDKFEPWIAITNCATSFDLAEPLQDGWSIRPVYKETGGKWNLMTQGQDQPWGLVTEGLVSEPIHGTATESIHPEMTQVIRTHDGVRIEATQSVPYRIYNLQGQCLRAGQLQTGQSQIHLPKGNYVLTIGDKPYKVFI